MVTVPTVLVLGAGASSHLGYPLGRELVAHLCGRRGAFTAEDLPAGWSTEQVDEFLTRLSRSDPGSIDAFLERNRVHGALGKYLIARQLKHVEEINHLFPPRDAGWYRYVFEMLLDRGEPNLDRNALTVVSFNYDRSLEAYLHTRLRYQFDLNTDNATRLLRKVRLIHVHGVLGEFPEIPYAAESSPDSLLRISEKIQIIHELSDQQDGFCNEMFRDANTAMAAAERIYFLGFGFHSENVRRFRFFSPQALQNKRVHATANQVGTIQLHQLQQELAPLGFTSEMFNQYECNQFFRQIAPLE